MAPIPTASQVVKVRCDDYLSRMRVVLNGEEETLKEGITIAQLIGDLGLNQRRIAVEINREIVARDAYETRALAANDEVEIVHFVGGG